mgnify:CR=1 FL=1
MTRCPKSRNTTEGRRTFSLNGFYNFIYNIFSYPFGYVIAFLYNLFHQNYLVAILFFAIIIKLILLPSSIKQQKNQAKSRRMQTRINKIKEKYKDDQQKQNEAITEFYQKEGFSSMNMGCGTLIFQFIIIMGLYGAIYKPLTYILRIDKIFGNGTVEKLTNAVQAFEHTTGRRAAGYNEITVLKHVSQLQGAHTGVDPAVFPVLQNFSDHFNAVGFNFGDIPKQLMHTNHLIVLVPILSFLFAMLSSIYTLWRTKKQGDATQSSMASMGCMMLTMPLISLWLAFEFPVGIGVYWAFNSLLGVIQMIILDRIYTPDKVIAEIMIDETMVRREKETAFKRDKQILDEYRASAED